MNSLNWLEKMASTPRNSSKQHTCEYCGKSYAKASTLIAHTCAKKQRALQKNEKRVRYGFHAYNRFNKLCLKRPASTYEQFCNDKFYNSFVKFGSYVSNVKPLYPEKYIDYIVTSGKKIKDWCDDNVYEEYVLSLIKGEKIDTALERSINTMIEWASEKSSEWFLYFDNVSVNKAVWDIKDGKISPWLILNSEKGKSMLSSFDDRQLESIYQIIDPEFWTSQFRLKKKNLNIVNELVKEYHL